LGKLTNLAGIDLRYNQLSGSIPSSLGNLPNLQYIQLGFNKLTGSIPSSFSNLKNLGIFGVDNNLLTGNVPSLANTTKLSDIFLSNNEFTGPVPDFHTSYLHGEIALDHNQFSGSIPDWLGNMTSAAYILLDHNKLMGNIPSALGNLTAISFIFLSDNQLTGSVPTSLLNLPSYATVTLENNHLTFDGIEDIRKANSTINFTYFPQLNIPLKYTTQGAFGKLSVHAGGTLSNNTYQWYKNNSLYATIVGDSTFIPTEEGAYFVKVNNSIVTNLQLVSDTIAIVTACSSTLVNTSTKNITSTSAKISWSASQGALKYQVQFKPASAATFTSKNTTSTSINLNGLSSNTQYVWKVKATCSLRSSAFTALNNFTTLPAFAAASQTINEIEKQTGFTFYPNPAAKNVNVIFNAAKQTVYSISIYDMQGRKLVSQLGVASLGENNFTLDIHALSSGTYLVKINYDDKTIVKKLVKE
jgi:hypothetical protein